MTRRDQEVSLEALVARIDAIAPASAAPDTVPSGFPSLDRVLGGGFRRQDLVVLGGDVGSGKSALALAIAVRAAQAGMPTLYLSGEMSPERVLERALALEGRAPIDDLRQGRLDASRAGRGRRGGGPPARHAAAAASAARCELRRGLGIARPGARPGARGGGLAAAGAFAPRPRPSWTSGSPWPSARSRRWRWSATWPCSRWRSCRGIAATGPTRGPRSTTSARSGASSRQRIWCWRSTGRRCTGRARAWKARRSSSSPRTATGRPDSWTCSSIRDGSGSRTCWIRKGQRSTGTSCLRTPASLPRCRSCSPPPPTARPSSPRRSRG